MLTVVHPARPNPSRGWLADHEHVPEADYPAVGEAVAVVTRHGESSSLAEGTEWRVIPSPWVERREALGHSANPYHAALYEATFRVAVVDVETGELVDGGTGPRVFDVDVWLVSEEAHTFRPGWVVSSTRHGLGCEACVEQVEAAITMAAVTGSTGAEHSIGGAVPEHAARVRRARAEVAR